MGISTSQQKVDMERFGPNHESTFRRKKSRKPGSTTYVWRHGRLMVKEDEPSVFVAVVNPHRGYHEEVERLNRELMQPYSLATPADLPHE